MTSPTYEGALEIERARGIDHDAEVWRRACEAMREACVGEADRRGRAYRPLDPGYADGCDDTARDIRSLPIPEMPR